ncbi:DNA repair protein RecN [Inhella gelatinilytica]|uniref:DNA repair protein RecN n=1 Tax=Inhella gelatinilytica TaxID=2795030 RepID=A0A931IUM6_9BURK|nr:DNA repair protein RecN [Inhella gelatinilytica]MBH9551310.1 DNA repair protein RecN [Inhella gelatinilytica]
MLRRLTLRDFVIVPHLELEFSGGFSALTGETGAGKSILLDALQLLLGARGDAGVVREGSAKAELSAAFDVPPGARSWLEAAGYDTEELLLRRVIDAQGKSRAWINGSPATVSQLGELGEGLIDIHGQHAWQKLTRPASVRALLDDYAGVDSAQLAQAHARWSAAQAALDTAQSQQEGLQRERERLQWQLDEVSRLNPGANEWMELNAEHERLSHAQALIDASRLALERAAEADDSAESQLAHAHNALQNVVNHDAQLQAALDTLAQAQSLIADAGHSLRAYLHAAEPDPQRLAELDDRLASWMQLARRYRRPPAELPALQTQWQSELAALDAQADLAALETVRNQARQAFDRLALQAQRQRQHKAPELANTVTAALQSLGMAGGRLEIALIAQDGPQSYGLESTELWVAGHAGASARPLAKVASGGELSRIALAIAVCTAQADQHGAPTLIFDEIDAGVGGAVAQTVGRLMQQLGQSRQVLAVTHLPQVAACAHQHWVVSKAAQPDAVHSQVVTVNGESRITEIARMLGGSAHSDAGRAHAQELLEAARP